MLIAKKIGQPSQQAWAMSCGLVGCLAGAMSFGYLSEHLGRKRALLISALVFTVSSVGTGEATTFLQFVIWRIVGGSQSVLHRVYHQST